MVTAVHVPDTLEDAISAAANGAQVIAGGTIVMPQVNTATTTDGELVSLRRLGLVGVAEQDGRVVIGAATTLAELLDAQAVGFLHDAVTSIASPQIRNMATVAGNFAKAPQGDMATCLLALDAEVEIATASGPRTASVASVIEQSPATGEIITSVQFDVPPEGAWRYTKAMRRKQNSAAVVTVAAVVEVEDNTVQDARVVIGGVSPSPTRAGSVEQALIGQAFDEATVQRAASLARQDVEPVTDAYASAWYRERVLPVHVRRALRG